MGWAMHPIESGMSVDSFLNSLIGEPMIELFLEEIDRIDGAFATEDTEIGVHNLSFLCFLLWLSVVDLHISDGNQVW
jgi:hypothetical protein